MILYYIYIYIYTGVYCIHWKNCKYIGEASRNIRKRLFAHRRDIRVGYLNNALLQHISESGHNFVFNAASIIATIPNKRSRRDFEVGDSFCQSISGRPRFYSILPCLGKLILNCFNIFHLWLISTHIITISPLALISSSLPFSHRYFKPPPARFQFSSLSFSPVSILSIYFFNFHLYLHLPFSHNDRFSFF